MMKDNALTTTPGQPLATTAPGLDEVFSRFLDDVDVKASSRATYAKQLRAWAAWLTDTGRIHHLASLTHRDFRAYRDDLAATRTPRTVNAYLTAVRKLYAWLEANHATPNITAGVKGMKRPQGHAKDVLAAGQLRAALDEQPITTLTGKRDYALFNLLARTGLRTIEIERATVGDVRQEVDAEGRAALLLYVQGKGRDEADAFVILTDEAAAPIKRYLNARRAAGERLTPTAPLFASHGNRAKGKALTTDTIRHIIKGMLRRVGIDDERITAHALRHTAITLAIRGGASIHDVQAMARHASITTTEGYYHHIRRVDTAAEKTIQF